jgi:NADH-quinone oxidoreductase subunit E
MVQINADFYEDLTPETFTRIINDFSAGRTPKPGPQIDRQNSAPIGGPTTLTDASIYSANGKSGGSTGAALTDSEGKKPGEAANIHEAPMPTPPLADATDPGRK